MIQNRKLKEVFFKEFKIRLAAGCRYWCDSELPDLEQRTSFNLMFDDIWSWINKHYISREDLPKRKRNSSHLKWLKWATKEPYNKRERIAFKRGYNRCLADTWKGYKTKIK